MTYELKNGEEVRDGKLYGWTGERCRHCSGTGEDSDNGLDENFISWRCNSCGGTGDEWGLMPVQPADLPPSVDEAIHLRCLQFMHAL
ncbi:MAG: hypothetical protein RB191_12530 [Terriglobia bacterium]|nr:hypothetical protein [Terriglobia bacterium]